MRLLVPGWLELAISLLLTLAVEMPFAYLWGLRGRRDLTLAVLANVLTNPAVVLLYYLIVSVTGWTRFGVQLPLEAAATTVEAWCYLRCGEDIRHPVKLAICANGLSYGVGLLLNLTL